MIFFEMGVIFILIIEVFELFRGKISRYGIEEYIVRGVVFFDFIECEVELKRYFLIRKMCEIKYLMKKYLFEIMSDGFVVYLSGEIY